MLIEAIFFSAGGCARDLPASWPSLETQLHRNSRQAEKMAKGGKKSVGRVGKQKPGKLVLKAKLKLVSKNTKAHIEKLNKDMNNVTSIHAELTKVKETQKQINVLDANSLRADLKRDEEKAEAAQRAESDLQSQLELITGMGL